MNTSPAVTTRPVVPQGANPLAAVEQYLLQELRTAEARAMLARLLAEAESVIEGRTSDPAMKALEHYAFAIVRNFIDPVATEPEPGGTPP